MSAVIAADGSGTDDHDVHGGYCTTLSSMRVLTGTSGFSYKEWKGIFYPADLTDKKMLAFYSSRLATVEVNNTFYRMPKSALLEKWRDDTPNTFRFALKASRRIT